MLPSQLEREHPLLSELTTANLISLLAGIAGVVAATFAYFSYRISQINGLRTEHYVLRRMAEMEPNASVEDSEGPEPISKKLLSEVRNLSRRLDRMESFSERLYMTSQEMASRNSYVINEALEQLTSVSGRLSQDLSKAEARVTQPAIQAGRDIVITQRGLDISKEMAHALKTPLARINVLSDIMASEAAIDPDRARHLSGIKSAVQVCQYYLDAFRSLLAGTSIAGGDEAKFKTSLKNALLTYVSASSKEIGVLVDAPERIRALPTYYAIAVLLPLVENAVEASADGDLIEITITESDNLIEAVIENSFHGKRPNNSIFKDGYTTKGGSGNEGLGLGIVKNFLSGLPQSRLDFEIIGKSRVAFKVTMGAKP